MGLDSKMGLDSRLRRPCPAKEPQDRAGQGPIHQPGNASQAPQPCTHPQTPWALPRATAVTGSRVPGREGEDGAMLTSPGLVVTATVSPSPSKPPLEPLSPAAGRMLGSSEEAKG